MDNSDKQALPVVKSNDVVDNEYTMIIGKRPKLYDLNKNYTNFDIEFQIEGEKPDLRFYVHILPQEQIEKADLNDIEMKLVQGRISGKISNGNNIYQNYFIIIKSDDLDEAKVLIRTRTTVYPVIASQQSEITTVQPDAVDGHKPPETMMTPTLLGLMKNPKIFYTVLVLSLVILLGGYYWYFHLRKTNPQCKNPPYSPVAFISAPEGDAPIINEASSFFEDDDAHSSHSSESTQSSKNALDAVHGFLHG